ncbi:tetratricopeptide repeat protein [Desertivirga xinjiangensis]|uniref:tetratricopeptide repeat protein n=1 Tax=Desertivirga xinjiangensis TaxID=539206 RepID=UPI002108E112|nr:tetratricopeptide repeat protein [Pedobacter xinjiangensis]
MNVDFGRLTQCPLLKIAAIINIFVILQIFPLKASSQKLILEKLQHSRSLIKQNPDAAFLEIKRLLKESQDNMDEFAIAVCYEQIGELFYYQAAYSQALDNYYKANSIFRKHHYDDELAGNLNKIGETYYYNRQYGIALKSFQEAISIYKKSNNRSGMATSYGFIGQTYEKNNDDKQAFHFQNLALAEFRKLEDQTGIAKIYENLGSIYEDKLQLDSALRYFNLALDLNSSRDDRMSQIEILNNIGDVFRKSGRYVESLIYSKKAEKLAVELNEPYQQASACRDLSKAFNLMGKNDSAYHYSEAGREVFMSIFSQDNKKQLLLLQTLFEIEQKDNTIIQFEKDRQANRLFVIAAIVIIVLLIALAVSIISKQRLKIINQHQLNQQNHSLFEAQKKVMEADLYTKQLKEENLKAELELKSKELTSHTLHLIQKNQLLEELKNKLNAMIKDEKRDQRKELKQVISLISFNNNQDKNWEDFRVVFERVHEHFFESLKKYCNTLTSSDLRLVALLKMNLSSSDIATMLGISQDSLRISRYRLRKKLNLEEGENLSSFIQRL